MVFLASKQLARSFGTRTKYCDVRRIHFALRRIPIREGFSGASLRAKCLRGGQSPLLWKAGGQSGAEICWRISPTNKLPDGSFSQAPPRRSPWLCQTRATLRASRPHASQAVGPLFRKILNFHFKIFNFKLRASADGAEGGTRTPRPCEY